MLLNPARLLAPGGSPLSGRRVLHGASFQCLALSGAS